MLLAVQADEAAHAPVRAALKAIEGTAYEIHWVTTPRAALAALEEHPHDAFLVDRDLREPGHSGLDVARDILAHTPARARDPARRPGRPRDRPGGDASSASSDYLVHPSPATLERSLRYAITHQRALRRLAESEERHALALQGANDGLWDWDVRADRLYFSPRWKAMIGYPEAEIGDAPGEWLGRVHPDDRAGLTQALEGHLSRRHPALRVRAPHPAPRRLLPLDARARDRRARPERARDARRRLPDRRHGPPPGRAAPAARRAARRADRAAQPRAVPRPPGAGDPPRAARAARHVLRGRAVPRPRPLQARQRLARPPRRRPAAGRRRAPAGVGPAPRRHRRAARRRRVHDPARRRLRRARGDRDRRARPGDAAGPVPPRRPRAVRRRLDRHRARRPRRRARPT